MFLAVRARCFSSFSRQLRPRNSLDRNGMGNSFGQANLADVNVEGADLRSIIGPSRIPSASEITNVTLTVPVR